MGRMAVRSATVMVSMALVGGGCRGRVDPPAGRPSLTSPVSVSPVVVVESSTTTAARESAPSPGSAPGRDRADPAEAEVLAGLRAIEEPLYECFVTQPPCDVAPLAAAGSPALDALEALRDHYWQSGLVVRRVPGLRYVVPEQVQVLGPTEARVTLCEVDGSWQVDPRETSNLADDVVVNDRLVSRRAVHHLVKVAGRWVRWEIEEVELWIGENRCPASSP